MEAAFFIWICEPENTNRIFEPSIKYSNIRLFGTALQSCNNVVHSEYSKNNGFNHSHSWGTCLDISVQTKLIFDYNSKLLPWQMADFLRCSFQDYLPVQVALLVMCRIDSVIQYWRQCRVLVQYRRWSLHLLLQDQASYPVNKQDRYLKVQYFNI